MYFQSESPRSVKEFLFYYEVVVKFVNRLMLSAFLFTKKIVIRLLDRFRTVEPACQLHYRGIKIFHNKT